MSKQRAQALNEEIETLDIELSNLERTIKKHPEKHILHYSKAKTLQEKAKYTNNTELYNESLASYNEAIKLTGNQNPHYIIKRAELLIKMGNRSEAFHDLQIASKLSSDILNKPLGRLEIEEMDTVNTIRSLAKLDEMQESISQLFSQGKLDKEMKDLFINQVIGPLTDIMQKTFDNVSYHDNLAQDVINIFSRLEIQLQENSKLSVKQVTELKNELRQHDKKLEDILSRFREIESVTQSLQVKVEENSRMNEDERKKAKETINKINDSLKKLSTKVESQDPILKKVITEVSKLSLEHENNSTKFYDLWIKVDELDNRVGSVETTSKELNKKIDENASISEKEKEEAKAVINKLTDALKKINMRVEAHEPVLKKITGEVQELLVNKEVNLVNIEDLWETIEEQAKRLGAVEVTVETTKQKFIELSNNIKADSKLKEEDKKEMNNKIGSIQEKLSIITNQEDIAVITAEVTKIITESKITKSRLSAIEEDIDSILVKQGSSYSTVNTAIVNIVNEITYDNMLLNNPNLLKKSLVLFNFNQILEASRNLDRELMHEAMLHNDEELVLGGIISLLGDNNESS